MNPQWGIPAYPPTPSSPCKRGSQAPGKLLCRNHDMPCGAVYHFRLLPRKVRILHGETTDGHKCVTPFWKLETAAAHGKVALSEAAQWKVSSITLLITMMKLNMSCVPLIMLSLHAVRHALG